MYFIPVIAIVLLAAVDQLIKYLVLIWLKPVDTVEVINNFFYLSYVENRGAAFGFMNGARWIFIAVTLLILIAAAIYYVRLPEDRDYSRLTKIAIVLIASGAIGNFIDRLFRGYVIDMLRFVFWGHSFAVFNFADMLVVCGTILLAGTIIFSSAEEGNDRNKL